MSVPYISLYELNCQVKQVLKKGFSGPVWIVAEITSIQENRSGHCYLELADKQEEIDKTLAVAKATIWSFTYGALKTYFMSVTGRMLEKGMKILVQVEVVFHELYGFSLNIKNIDPTFTVGDLERKRREILEMLERDGIIHMNKELEWPLLPKNIAVISSPTAAGYGDFMKQLRENPYAYKFHVQLFPAVMQGENTTDSIISALEKIYEYEALFDVVVIIRGGGSQTELGSFDTYDLAANIAQFPIPVIAGIGHERDETIVDKVAHLSVKTPTAAAGFLIECFHRSATLLQQHQTALTKHVKNLLSQEKNRHHLILLKFKGNTKALLQGKRENFRENIRRCEFGIQRFIEQRYHLFRELKNKLSGKLEVRYREEQNRQHKLTSEMKRHIKNILEENSHHIELAETKMKYIDPVNILNRGYSITRFNGKAIISTTHLKSGDQIETQLADGKINSQVL